MVRTASRTLLAATAALLVFCGQAHAAFGVAAFDGEVTADAAHTPFTQAGGHPFAAATTIRFNTHIEPVIFLNPVLDGNFKDIQVDLPPGFAGNPTAVAQCTSSELSANSCPTASQVGVVSIESFGLDPSFAPVYNLVPPPHVPGAFAFNIQGFVTNLVARVRSDGDYGLTVDLKDINQGLPVETTSLTFWGVPADPVHDSQRCTFIQGATADGDPLCVGDPGTILGPHPAGIAAKPFLTNPVTCTPSGQGLETTLRTDSWQHPGDFVSAAFVSHNPPGFPLAPDQWGSPQGTIGCDRVPFDPSMSVALETSSPDAPTGLTFDLSFPTDGIVNPTGIATGPLKDATVTLPEGMTINPSAANGLTSCGDADLQLKSLNATTCPESSKVGTVTATTPLLAEPLTGGIYIRAQNSDDPESGEMYRIALVLESTARGLSFRLPGSIRVDKDTGRIVTEFDNNPQLPVADIKLAFKSGPRAPLATPATCGQKTIEAELSSWSGKTVDRQSTFTIDCTPGLGGFAPSFTAGTVRSIAGVFSPFGLSVTKPDGHADVNGLSMVLPTGLLAHLKGNVGTQVGTVKAFAGPGSNPFMLSGQVFLEGAYGDAPFSLRVVVPAKAGPFDLGTVEVRQKIYVDPIDAHVTVVSDPIPTIVKGVPVRLQRLDVSVDKPGFVVNPTSCAAKAFGGTLGAVGGQSAPINVRFQVGECASLALRPKLDLTLSGKGQTTDGKHPAISATLTQPAGGANLKKVRVALPSSLALDPDNAISDGLCSFVEGSKPLPVCPTSSVVGKATAVSPILNQPLSGPVYFVKNERKDPKSGRSIKTTPKLVIPLTGENGVKLTLTGVSSVPDNEHLVTTFDAIPDAPVSSFKLDINGGEKGILVVSGTDICKATQIADQQVDGQNNKAADADVYIQTPACPTKIISKNVGKRSVTLKIGGLGAGKVTVTGRGIRKATRTIAKSTVATITAKRTGHGTPGNFKVKFTKAKAKVATAAR